MSMLYVVPTPIGNLEDMTMRAIRILKEVDLILAEDTRTSGKLLKHFEVSTPMQSHHMHNEHQSLPRLVEKLTSGSKIALLSDAGTPAISDPGFFVVKSMCASGYSCGMFAWSHRFCARFSAKRIALRSLCF